MHLPADMVGHVCSLHSATPVFVSVSWITWIRPVRSLFISTTVGYQYITLRDCWEFYLDVQAILLIQHSWAEQPESKSYP